MSRDSLRFVSGEDEGEDAEGDSDDEDLAPGLEGVSKREHLSVTAVNLLLALLQGKNVHKYERAAHLKAVCRTSGLVAQDRAPP